MATKTNSVLVLLLVMGVGGGVLLGRRLRERPRPLPATADGAGAPPALPPPSSAQLADARALGRGFAEIASRLSVSVVRISSIKRPRQQSMGSGVVVDSAGHILTNHHVIEGASEVEVTFVDGRSLPGRVVGADPKSDLAVVKVDGAQVQPAKLGDSDQAAVGDWVIAIGNPFGLDHTITVGVLSAKNRSGFDTGKYEDFLQTDAAIHPGNSGGPLVNLQGEVIGINTMIAGIGTGIGFAVPSSMARPIADQLIRNGVVRRAYLGVLMQDLTPELRTALGEQAPEKGALVGQVEAGSPAAHAGVEAGDVITGIDGASVDGSKAVQRAVLRKQVGQHVVLALWHEGKVRRLELATAELPTSETATASKGLSGPNQLGLGLATLTPELAARLGLERHARGAVVTGVRPGSLADDAGVRRGDVVLEVDHRPVAGAEQAAAALSIDRPSGHLLRLDRAGAALFVVVR